MMWNNYLLSQRKLNLNCINYIKEFLLPTKRNDHLKELNCEFTMFPVDIQDGESKYKEFV